MSEQVLLAGGTDWVPDDWDLEQASRYLTFGFLPDGDDAAEPLSLLAEWSRRPRRRPEDVDPAALVREGVRALRAAVAECAAAPGPGGDQVVFLSGGLDSRAILGALLEQYDASRIVAATFGRPGEQDFDFAAAVAREAGVRHEVLDSFEVDWITDGLVDSVLARRVPLPSPFGQRYLSYRLHEQIGRGNVFWDGLCGDGIGGKLSPREGETWDWPSALDGFLRFHLLPGWKALVPAGFDPRDALPTRPFAPVELMEYPDQLVFGVRQRCNTGTRRLRDYAIRTPFLAGPWLDFMLTVPTRYRQDQRIYRQVQRAAFPRLFSLPTTALDGGAVTEPRVLTLLRDLGFRARRKASRLGLAAAPATASGANAAIRRGLLEEGSLRGLVAENLLDLDDRGLLPHVDVRALLVGRPAAGAPADPSFRLRAVRRLLDLELNLKASERVAETAARDSSAA
jgi:hypothetical protein